MTSHTICGNGHFRHTPVYPCFQINQPTEHPEHLAFKYLKILLVPGKSKRTPESTELSIKLYSRINVKRSVGPLSI